MPNDPGSTREMQMMVYQVTVGDLTYFKSQQWSLTNHCFLLLVGLLGARQLLGKPIALWELWALVALVACVVVAGITLINKIQDSIVVRQARLDAAREKLGLEFYTTWAAKAKSTEYVHAVWILRGALTIGGIVVCWLLFQGT
jgi:hypothetical protein